MDLANNLKGKIPTDTISIEIVNHLHSRVSERFIHECLDDKYKQKYRVENARKQEGNENYGKHHTEVIRDTHVDYVFYSNGTVTINTTCSRNPHKLESEDDRSRIMAFFGQIRDRLILLLHDKHERLVLDIMKWQLTEADINKDIRVSDYFHYTGTKIQVRHMNHLFIIYIKSMGKNTVCRLQERKHRDKKTCNRFHKLCL